jgi:hypothetical protein
LLGQIRPALLSYRKIAVRKIDLHRGSVVARVLSWHIAAAPPLRWEYGDQIEKWADVFRREIEEQF